MKRAPLLAVVIAVGIVGATGSAACGTFLAEPDAGAGDAAAIGDAAAFDAVVEDGTSTSDATTDAKDSNVVIVTDAVTPPAVPADCPLNDCPSAELVCKDEDCANPDSLDFTITGTIGVANGTCTAAATVGSVSSMSRTLSRPQARRYVTLSVNLKSLQTADRPIAAVFVAGAPNEERIEIVAKGNTVSLCEHAATVTRCTPPLAITLPVTVHLYGVVSSESPPNATFALGVDPGCAPARALALTRPFLMGDIEGVAGCLEGGTAPCSLVLDDVALLLHAE